GAKLSSSAGTNADGSTTRRGCTTDPGTGIGGADEGGADEAVIWWPRDSRTVCWVWVSRTYTSQSAVPFNVRCASFGSSGACEANATNRPVAEIEGRSLGWLTCPPVSVTDTRSVTPGETAARAGVLRVVRTRRATPSRA